MGISISIVVMGVIVVALVGVAYSIQGWPMVIAGFRTSGYMLQTVWLRMILGLLMAGMVQVVIPAEAIGHLMGEGAGLRGILVGTLAGSITPGGPFVNFPIVAALRGSGAGFGPLAAYLTAWGLIPVHRTLIWEFSFMGPKFVFARLLASLAVPIFIGLATPAIMETVFRLSKTKIAG